MTNGAIQFFIKFFDLHEFASSAYVSITPPTCCGLGKLPRPETYVKQLKSTSHGHNHRLQESTKHGG